MGSMARALKRRIAKAEGTFRKSSKKPPAKADPAVVLNRKRAKRKNFEEFKMYGLIDAGTVDLFRRLDYKHAQEVASVLGWSVGRVNKVLDRIFKEAEADVRREDRIRNNGGSSGGRETGSNKEVQNRGVEGISNDHDDARGGN